MQVPINISTRKKRFGLFIAGHTMIALLLFARPVLAQDTAPEVDGMLNEIEAWRTIGVRIAQVGLGFYLVYYLFGMVGGDRAGNMKSVVLVVAVLIALESFEQLFGSLAT